jgi:hypothetical protein
MRLNATPRQYPCNWATQLLAEEDSSESRETDVGQTEPACWEVLPDFPACSCQTKLTYSVHACAEGAACTFEDDYLHVVVLFRFGIAVAQSWSTSGDMNSVFQACST